MESQRKFIVEIYINELKFLCLWKFLESEAQRSFFVHYRTSTQTSTLTKVQRLSRKCLSLEFLQNLCEQVIGPDKAVADLLCKVVTSDKNCCLMDMVDPDIQMVNISAFVSHANNNKFMLLMDTLTAYYRDNLPRDVSIYILTSAQ